MIVTASAFHVARTKLAAVALVTAMAVSGHAVAKNHDAQLIRFPAGPSAGHDHAAGPTARSPD